MCERGRTCNTKNSVIYWDIEVSCEMNCIRGEKLVLDAFKVSVVEYCI